MIFQDMCLDSRDFNRVRKSTYLEKNRCAEIEYFIKIWHIKYKKKMKDYKYHIGIKGKLYLSNQKKHIVALNDGASRYVYNHLVATNNEKYFINQTAKYVPCYQERLEYLNSVTDARGIKNSAPFLYEKDIDSSAIDNAIKNYHEAWEDYKITHCKPVFHKKGYTQSYQTCNHYKGGSTHMNDGSIRFEDNHHIILPLLGRVRIGISPNLIKQLNSRTAETRIGTATISRDAVGEYWFSLQMASDEPFREELKHTGCCAGIDLNLDNFLTDSNNVVIDNPRFLKEAEKKLAKEQRKLSRRMEQAKKDGKNLHDAKNYQKQRQKVAFLQRKVARQRNDFQHNLSKDYIENQDIIAAEDLKVRNLKKNHKLAKAISDAGWRSFLTKLQYKGDLYNKQVILIDPKNTTQMCSSCGYVMKGEEKLTLADREWTCPHCGTYHIRDHNAAKNILARALSSISSAT